MSFPQRLMVFCVGVGLGALLAFYIIKNRGLSEREGPPTTLAEAEVEAVPKILQTYEERGEPMQSTFIVGEFTQPGPEVGTYRRVLVIEGRQPGQLLRIEELQRAQPNGPMKVEQWRVMAADRAVISLKSGVKPASLREALAQYGYRLMRRGEEPGQYVISLGAHEPETVDLAIERLGALGPQITAVTPDYLDKPTEQP